MKFKLIPFVIQTILILGCQTATVPMPTTPVAPVEPQSIPTFKIQGTTPKLPPPPAQEKAMSPSELKEFQEKTKEDRILKINLAVEARLRFAVERINAGLQNKPYHPNGVYYVILDVDYERQLFCYDPEYMDAFILRIKQTYLNAGWSFLEFRDDGSAIILITFKV